MLVPYPDTGSAPGIQSPAVWGSAEYRSRIQPVLPHTRVCLHIPGNCPPGHLHVHRRLGDLIWRRRLAVAEVPHARLSTRTSGLVGPPTLGERGCLTLSRSPGLGEFLTQLFDRRRQTRNLILLSADQGDQLLVFTGGEPLSVHIARV